MALFLSCATARTMTQLETCAPVGASIEQIACLIYVNVARCIKHEVETCQLYFENLNLHVFQ